MYLSGVPEQLRGPLSVRDYRHVFFDDALEFRFKADTTWADAHEDDKAAVTRLWNWIDSCKDDPAKFLAEYNQYFGNDSPFAWYLITDYFMAVDNRAKT